MEALCDRCHETWPAEDFKRIPAKASEHGYDEEGEEAELGEGILIVCPECFTIGDEELTSFEDLEPLGELADCTQG